jgi:integrase
MAAQRQGRRRGSVTYRGIDTWLVRVTLGVDGAGQQLRLNKTVRGPKREADKLLTELLNRRDQGTLREKPTKQTLGQWVEEWLTRWCIDVSDRTRNDYRAIFERYLWPDRPNHLHPDKAAKVEQAETRRPPRNSARTDDGLTIIAKQLRAKKLAALTAGDVQDFVNALRACGLAPRTVRMAHGAIRAALSTAVRQKKLAYNVATDASLPRQIKTEVKFFTPEEGQRFLDAAEAAGRAEDAADAYQGTAYAAFVVMLMSGMRVGELLGLKWADLDERSSTLRVQRAVTQDAHRRKTLGPTKTCRTRAIPLGPRAMRALQAQRVRQAKWRLKLGDMYGDEGLIFANEMGGLLEAQNVSGRYFKPLLRSAKLPNLSLYGLRHSHATLLLAAGEHPKVVQERLGHSSIQLTLDTYTHVVEGLQERASERLEALLASPARTAQVSLASWTRE